MDLRRLDEEELFSLTLWRSEGGYTVGVQKRAGDLVRYSKGKTISEAIEALFPSKLPELPY